MKKHRGVLALVVSTLCHACSALVQAQGADQPNIVFAFADDWGRYASAYREPDRPTINDVIRTPNFDTLAANGVLFWDAHVSAPSCTPSRTAVLTGRHFYCNGSGSQLHSPWSGEKRDDPVLALRSYHQLLKDAGYHTGVTYKTHVAMHLFNGKAAQYNHAGTNFNRFSQQVSRGQTPEERQRIKQKLLDEVRNNMRQFLDEGEDQATLLLVFQSYEPASDVGLGISATALGTRSGRPPGEAACVSAG